MKCSVLHPSHQADPSISKKIPGTNSWILIPSLKLTDTFSPEEKTQIAPKSQGLSRHRAFADRERYLKNPGTISGIERGSQPVGFMNHSHHLQKSSILQKTSTVMGPPKHCWIRRWFIPQQLQYHVSNWCDWHLQLVISARKSHHRGTSFKPPAKRVSFPDLYKIFGVKIPPSQDENPHHQEYPSVPQQRASIFHGCLKSLWSPVTPNGGVGSGYPPQKMPLRQV